MSLAEVTSTYLEIQLASNTTVYGIYTLSLLVLTVIIWAKTKMFFRSAILSIILVNIFLIIYLFTSESIIEDKRLNNWKDEVKENYIQKLEIVKVDDVNFTINDVRNKSENDTQYFTDDVEDFKSIMVEFEVNGLPTKAEITAEIIRVKDLDSPYLEYQQVNKDIPNIKDSPVYFPKGYYNAKLYIAE